MSLVGTVDQAEEKAAAKGLRCVLPKPSELFIDIDNGAAYDRFLDVFIMLTAKPYGSDLDEPFGPRMRIVRDTPSPSGLPDRRHIVVDTGRPLASELERVALQAILGSDPKREAASWLHLQQGVTNVSRFFEKPQPIKFESEPF